jgi:hypothetical protein
MGLHGGIFTISAGGDGAVAFGVYIHTVGHGDGGFRGYL